MHLLSLERQQVHPDPLAPPSRSGNGSAGRHGPDHPDPTRTSARLWPALPVEAGGQTGDQARDEGTSTPPRDPWPALPDDRELWTPAVAAYDADRLAWLDREQAGD
ncbi:hypothetical protein [Micromonospora sp. NPDC004551]|uniref:hypothetical protein n=1 Tax=Micromonospora sp. NPDC004551 TaxID=3154284 RepID=UPI0033AA4A1D